MDDAPILVCYDRSADSDRAIEAAGRTTRPARRRDRRHRADADGCGERRVLRRRPGHGVRESLHGEHLAESTRRGRSCARARVQSRAAGELVEPAWEGIIEPSAEQFGERLASRRRASWTPVFMVTSANGR